MTKKITKLKKIHKRVINYVHKNPATSYGWIVFFTTYLVKRFPEIPNELIIMTLLSVVGLSKKVQAVENKKTEDALYTIPPK